MVPLSRYLCANFFQENFILIIIVIVLLILSAFFSACEMSFSTANAIRIRNMADDKVKGARRALYICENYDRILSTILVANNLVNIANTTICTVFFLNLFVNNPTLANVVNTVVMTILILIFGEILPKSFAKMNPEKFALTFSNVMYFFYIILYPITIPFIGLQKIFLKQVKNNTASAPTVTEDELESIIDTMEEEGVLESNDAELIQGVLDLSEKTAYDIMTPRVDITAIELKATKQEIMQTFIDSNYSRLPVYNGDIDHIVGILNQKEYYPTIINQEKFDITNIITEPLFLNGKTKVDDIIRQMQKEKKHMAIVLDEYGGTSGIVCLEDALETMVGEIYDEHDDEEDNTMFKKIGDNQYLVDADIDLEKLFNLLKIENMPSTEYSTLGGFLYELANTIPSEGQTYTFTTIDEIHDKSGGYSEKAIKMNFKLTSVEDKRIREVQITIT